MRAFAVSSASLCLLAVFAPSCVTASVDQKARKGGKLSYHKKRAPDSPDQSVPSGGSGTSPVFDFVTATSDRKVVFLANAGEVQAAVECFLAMTVAERLVAVADREVRKAYDKSIKSFVRLPRWEKYRGASASSDAFRGLTDAENVRAHWGGSFFEAVIEIYERSSSCKTDSKATAAYLDAKMRKTEHGDFLTFDFEHGTLHEKMVLLNHIGHHQGVVEMYLAASPQERSHALEESSHASGEQSHAQEKHSHKKAHHGQERLRCPVYERSLREVVSFTPAPNSKWGDFSDAEKVRAFHQDDKCADAMAVYYACDDCRKDSKATAAFLDCELQAANLAKAAAEKSRLEPMSTEL